MLHEKHKPDEGMRRSRMYDVILTRSGSLDTGYEDLDDATSSEGR